MKLVKKRFVEHKLTKFDNNLKNEFLALQSSCRPLIIRDSKLESTLKDWHSFFVSKCNLYIDKRQKSKKGESYLSDFFEVSNQSLNSNTYAYSNTRFPLHNDNAWYSDGAEIVFLYMKKQSMQGGESFFYPLDDLIIDLQKEEKELFKDLTSIPIKITKGKDNNFNQTTVIRKDGEWKIFWNYYRTVKKDKNTRNMCDKFFEYLLKKLDSDRVLKIRLESNDSCAFNDQRVLHGREKFLAKKDKERIAYLSMLKIKKEN